MKLSNFVWYNKRLNGLEYLQFLTSEKHHQWQKMLSYTSQHANIEILQGQPLFGNIADT